MHVWRNSSDIIAICWHCYFPDKILSSLNLWTKTGNSVYGFVSISYRFCSTSSCLNWFCRSTCPMLKIWCPNFFPKFFDIFFISHDIWLRVWYNKSSSILSRLTLFCISYCPLLKFFVAGFFFTLTWNLLY